MKINRPKSLILALALFGVAACADSTGPGSVGADDALRSLSLALGSESGGDLLFALPPSSLGSARVLDQIDVGVNGRTERMYALGLRVTYPSGTCLESLVIFPPSQGFPSGCTAPPHGLVLVLWQTTSGSRPPESLAIISADVGTSSFDFSLDLAGDQFDVIPFGAFAMYINDREEFWSSIAGTLTSQVTATSETCSVPAPSFAKASTCHVANFAESGQITFERLDLDFFGAGSAAPRVTMDLVIPPQSIRGILQAITEIQPITLPVQ
jgi:hypothetical protein